MTFFCGVLVGGLAVWLFTHRPKTADKKAVAQKQQQLLHEYRNFLNYNGEQQEEYHGRE